MIITKMALSDITDSAAPKASLLMVSHMIEASPRLVSIDWLAAAQTWQESKSLNLLKRYYAVSDEDFEFMDKNSLSINDPTQALLLNAIQQFKEYAEGQRKSFVLPLELSLGTEFQQRVWAALQEIPYGETISYAQLAANIGQPTAYRAVANANGKNPFSIVIPCHRVIASDGRLGGYTGGIDKKQYLLALEKETCRL